MLKSIFLPVILMAMVGGPMLYSHHQRNLGNLPESLSAFESNAGQAFLQTSTPVAKGATSFGSQQPSEIGNLPFASTSVPFDAAQSFAPKQQFQTGFQPSNVAASSVSVGIPQSANQIASPTVDSGLSPNLEAWNQQGMVPDYGRAETVVFSGDANGPNLEAAPMSFVPVTDFSMLFRFDHTKQWVISRWERVSTCPADRGLHGMRVALVTGTNSWDLHGSLTYFFDANHRVQRITFRGWTGDASRLLQLLSGQFGLRPQPTHWAGMYLSKNSGLLMKHPAVIDRSNPVQQLAIVLELNNPQGNVPLSEDFQSLLPAAKAVQ